MPAAQEKNFNLHSPTPTPHSNSLLLPRFREFRVRLPVKAQRRSGKDSASPAIEGLKPPFSNSNSSLQLCLPTSTPSFNLPPAQCRRKADDAGLWGRGESGRRCRATECRWRDRRSACRARTSDRRGCRTYTKKACCPRAR